MPEILRSERNPIITRDQIPFVNKDIDDVSSVFNPGAIMYKDKFLLLMRVQSRARETFFMIAESTDGIDFTVRNEIVEFKGIEKVEERIYHLYDARITEIDGVFYIMFAMDMDGCCKLGLGKTTDFEEFEFVGIVSEADTRNGVLFPEKINGKYLRYDRPNKFQVEGGPKSGSAIFLSESDDLLNWNEVAKVMDGRFHYWDELIGSGPAPIKTKKGWLCIYHGIAFHYTPIYQAGVALFDLDDPSKLIGRGKHNILEPRRDYETVGQVPNVIFPSGAVVENYDEAGFAMDDSKVFIYYGAADTSIGLATTKINELIMECL